MTAINDPKFAELDARIARRLAHDDIPGSRSRSPHARKRSTSAVTVSPDIARKPRLDRSMSSRSARSASRSLRCFSAEMRDQGLVDVHKPVTRLPSLVLGAIDLRTDHDLTTAHATRLGIIGGSDMAADGRVRNLVSPRNRGLPTSWRVVSLFECRVQNHSAT